jgi:serine/threonine protein phosphatase PrpC
MEGRGRATLASISLHPPISMDNLKMAPLSFVVVDAVSEPSGAVNEDRWGAVENACWVMDGATGLTSERVLPGPSDALWLMERIDAGLKERAADAETPADALRPILSDARIVFAKTAVRPDASMVDLPCGAVTMLRLRGTDVELSSLGDCRIVHGDDMRCFGTSKVTALDDRLVEEVVRLQQRNMHYREIWQRVLPMTRYHRSLRNLPQGYWNLDLSGAGLDHIEIERVPARSGGHFLLMSDGFYRLVDVYRRYTYATLMEAAQSRGLATLIDELREVEADDVECRKYPRLKPRDDATAVLVRVGNLK